MVNGQIGSTACPLRWRKTEPRFFLDLCLISPPYMDCYEKCATSD